MWDSSGNGGQYREGNSLWHYYWNVPMLAWELTVLLLTVPMHFM